MWCPRTATACELARITNFFITAANAAGQRTVVLAYEFGPQPRTNSVQVNGFTNCGYVSGNVLPPGVGEISFTCTFACSGSASYTFDARVASEGFGCGVIDMESITLTLPEKQGSVSIDNYRNTAGEIRLFGAYTLAAGDASAQLRVQQLPTFAENGDPITAAPIDVPITPGHTFDIPFTPATGARHLELEAQLTSCGTLARDTTIVECDCNGSSHDPVAWVDGNTRYTDTDPLPPHLNSVALTRTYDTYHRFRSYFGRGWWSFFDARLAVHTSAVGELVTLTTESNDSAVFLKNGSNYTQLSPKAPVPGTLTFEATGSRYVYRAAGRRTALLYRGSDGRFAGLRDLASGREMTVNWSSGLPSSVVDTWTGLTWSITTDTTKRRITAIGIGSLAWGYEYDSGDNLQRVAAPGNATWRTYEHDIDRMTTARDGDGREIENHTYDSVTGAATSSTGPGDEISGIQYNVAGSTGNDTITRVTMKTGLIADYQLRPIGGAYRLVRVIGGCGSCSTNDATYAYDERGHLTLEQDARGFITRSEYDASAGTLLQRSTHLRPSQCDPEDTATNPDRCRMTPDELTGAIETGLVATRGTSTTRYEYLDTNWPELPTAISVDSVVGVLRPVGGHAPQELRENERRDTFTYDVNGEILSHDVSGWSGGAYVTRTTTTTLYDGIAVAAFHPGGSFEAGWMTFAQPKGLRSTIDGARTDVNDVTQFVYYPVDASVPATLRGHPAAVRNALGQITRYEQYDVFGNVTRIVDANQVATVMTFDALGRVLTTTIQAMSNCDTAVDPLCATDLTSTRTYSGAGPLLAEERPSGAVTSYMYEGRGRIATVSRGYPPRTCASRSSIPMTSRPGKRAWSGRWRTRPRRGWRSDASLSLTTTSPDSRR